MTSRRPSFAKREREMKLKDKARAKAERRLARRAEVRTGNGPPNATAEEVAAAHGPIEGPSATSTTTDPPGPSRPR